MALLFTLLLSFTFSASLAVTPYVVHSSTDASINYPGGSVSLNREDMQVNLIVNQLAILKLFNHTNLGPGGGDIGGGLVAEMRELREEMKTTLQNHQTTWQQQLMTLISSMKGTGDTAGQECLVSVKDGMATVKETQASLRRDLDDLKEELATLKRESEEKWSGRENDAEEVRSIKSVLAALKANLSLHVIETKNKMEALSASVSGEVSRLQASLTNFTNIYITEQNTCRHTCNVEGEIKVHNNCSISDCHEGCLRPYQGSTASLWSSALLDGKCVHLFSTSMTWDNSRAVCVTLGGDLYVAGDFQEAVQYVVESGFDVWVGVKERTWLDGRSVTEQEWATGQPDDVPESCAFIRPSNKALRDAPCTSSGSFLCLTEV